MNELPLSERNKEKIAELREDVNSIKVGAERDRGAVNRIADHIKFIRERLDNGVFKDIKDISQKLSSMESIVKVHDKFLMTTVGILLASFVGLIVYIIKTHIG